MALGEQSLCTQGTFLVDPLLDRQQVQLLECGRHVVLRTHAIYQPEQLHEELSATAPM